MREIHPKWGEGAPGGFQGDVARKSERMRSHLKMGLSLNRITTSPESSLVWSASICTSCGMVKTIESTCDLFVSLNTA